jgi:predicted glycoside hydrolase/deacetylase ChbG (UPF0249 family)
MSIRLIVNADDYGRDDEVSRGIRHSHLHGIVTSTTAMMNMPACDANLRLAGQETPRLVLGVHLVLTSGKPILNKEAVPTLVDEQGAFLRPGPLRANLARINPAEVHAEWRAQIEKYIRVVGHSPSHLDSHHHSSYYSGGLFRIMLILAQEYDCAIRLPGHYIKGKEIKLDDELNEWITGITMPAVEEFHPRTPHRFIGTFYDDQVSKPVLLDILQHLGDEDTEIMCHPGYAGEQLIVSSIYNVQREREVEILTDPEVKRLIQERQVSLISFADLDK